MVALLTTTVTFLMSLFDLGQFDYPIPASSSWNTANGWQRHQLQGGRRRHLVLFVMLTTFLMPICDPGLLGREKRVKEYMIAFLVLETLMIGVFCALDLVLFYLFFEAA
jgi:NADH-quinone oxidoreductase subunit M